MCPMKTTPRWLLILGLAFVFGYFGIDKFWHPILWIQWIPDWMDGLIGMNKDAWLKLIGASEIILAVGLLLPSYLIQRIAAALCGLHLLGVLTQTGWNDVAVRDIGLLAIAITLVIAQEEK